MKNTVVLYHSNCPDGFGAAWAAWKKFGNRADYIAVNPGILPKKTLKNKEIYVLDNSYPEKIVKKLKRENKSIIIIDHHISARKDVKSASSFVFDLKHSGAVLAWRYFNPKKKVPRFLLHIEDFDLWKFKLPHTREVDILLELIEFNFRAWDTLAREMGNPRRREIKFREAALLGRYKYRLINKIVESAELVSFAGKKTLAVNSPIFSSEIGNLLCRKLPPIGIVWRSENGKITVSLRSNGKADASKIAKRFGGGGHKASAGFGLSRNAKFPWKSLNS
ncbi:MAG: DHHA1 domain-containing protein [Candidatus Jorgensenbacteria bacterium]